MEITPEVVETAFMTDAASEFENRNKCCKFCKRRILTQVTVETALCDSANETKSTTNFLSTETNSIGKKEQERKHKIDYGLKDIGSLVTALNRLSSALAKSECYHELSAGTQGGEPEVSEYLSKEASDAIRCVKLCLLGLQNGSKSLEQHTTSETLIESIIQGELSDVMNSFVSNTVSAGNNLVTTGTGLQQGIYAMPLHHEPGKANGWPVEMNAPYLKGMGSQVIDRAGGHDSGTYAPFQIGNPYKEKNPGDWFPNNKVESIKGETEPMYKATMQNYPSSYVVARGLLPYNEEMLTNDQIRETQLEYQAIPADKFKRSGSGVRKLSQQSAVLKEYRTNQRANQESGADSKLSRTLRAHKKYSLPGRTKQQTLTDNHPDAFTMPITSSSKWKDDNAVRFRRINDRKHPRRKILQHKHDPDDKYTDSSSSHRRNQESSGSTSYAERFHTPSHNWSKKYVTSTASSESEMLSPLPSGEETSSSHVSNEDYEQTSSRTSYESEEYSMTSRATSDEVSLSDDSEGYGYGLSSHGQTRKLQHHKKPSYLSIDSTSDRIGSTRKSKLPKVMNLKKNGGGAWKKFKDKLSIIFHHHHHHHHHHHQPPTRGDEKDLSTHDIRTKHGKKTVEKVEKSIIKAGGTRKDKHKHLSTLVGALFRHIRHKKKSNASIIKRLGKGKHGAKNMWKKKH